ncbi:MAG: cell division protein ZapA [Lachnospiraceae bacterium]|nr:cell division protein ZapA [Lachnospiraceae bacterium]
MAAKNKIQVLIGGKIYTLSGYESEEYLQKVAAYLNNKITEIRSIDGYQRLSPEMRSLLLNLNTADDYFKLRKQADQLGDQIAEKDRELYEIKHELISVQMQIETKDKALAALQEEAQASAKRIVQLETQLEALKDRKG